MYAYILGKVKNSETAAELAQETKLRALEAAEGERFDFHKPFLPWLLGIAHRVLQETGRRIEKQETLRRRLETQATGRAERTVQERSAAKELGRRVLEAVEACPEEYRLPLLLRYMEERSYEEIAAKLSLSIGQVKGLIYRGTKMLRSLLEAEYRQWLQGGRRDKPHGRP